MEEDSVEKKRKEGGIRETTIAVLVCSAILIVPMLYIEYEYKLFTKTHGKAMEGAAGGALALAVVFRTVSRTVLRTVVRTSARAGMRASLRGAIRAGARAMGRTHSMNILKGGFTPERDPSEVRRDNFKSLLFASALLYLSWVIVIGFGQPYSSLMDDESNQVKQQMEVEEADKKLLEFEEKAKQAFLRRLDLEKERDKLHSLRKKKKMLGNAFPKKRRKLDRQIKQQIDEIDYAELELKAALKESRNEEINPFTEESVVKLDQGESNEQISRFLRTSAPYPAEPSPEASFSIDLQGVVDLKGQQAQGHRFQYSVGSGEMIVLELSEPEPSANAQEGVSTDDSVGGLDVDLKDDKIIYLCQNAEGEALSLDAACGNGNGKGQAMGRLASIEGDEVESIASSEASESDEVESDDNNLPPKLIRVKPAPGERKWVLLNRGIEFEFDKPIEAFDDVVLSGTNDVSIISVEIESKKLIVKLGGKTPWSSPVIWLGGLGIILPLWVIFALQAFWARREKQLIQHETGSIGGGIQLYFAGAFSFMPLTSDVVVPNANASQRGRIALVGLLGPTAIFVALWMTAKQFDSRELLFLSDAFLIYPMVQCFPLNPLEGIYVWRWRKSIWLLSFFIIMGFFMFSASEALRHVI